MDSYTEKTPYTKIVIKSITILIDNQNQNISQQNNRSVIHLVYNPVSYWAKPSKKARQLINKADQK